MSYIGKKNVLLVIAILVLALTLSACGGQPPVQEEPENTVPIEVTVMKKSEITNNLIYAGQVKPKEQISVMPKSSGKVDKIYFDVGDRVNVDAVLFTIDEEDVRKNINILQAQYTQALQGVNTAVTSYQSVTGSQTESNQSKLEGAYKNAEIALQNAETSYDSVKIQLENAVNSLDKITTTYNNSKVLYDAGAMTKNDFDNIELQYNQAVNAEKQARTTETQTLNTIEQAKLNYEKAKEDYELYVGKTVSETTKTAQSSVNSAQASANVTKVQLDNARATLNDLNVKSPIAGVITAKNIEVGGIASAQNPAFTIVDMDTVYINVNISEELINIVKPGQEVSVLISTVSDKVFKGIISTVSPAADNVTNTYPVKIELNNSSGVLKPGMFAEATFKKETSTNTFVVPRNTVFVDVDSQFVYVEKDGVAVKTLVETGIDTGKEIEITKGLKVGDRLIVTGHKNVSNGIKVKVIDTVGGEAKE